ncbi:MAG: sulfotransferase domain-containing protein [Vicingaceae bacterium]|nr:sulfotransferase domain-containing protein [Flavobacteriales bacterium]MBQ21340.1 hypothetical protein [Flavobacteriales bacterium]MDF1674262.1 sulfotransferase domain-containing protein [Vicingaceae bacterium]|tara:strand:+ start:17010 stop:17987 length:978 start_codon:yes stop_codon:yes gene_type:complete
MSKINYSNKKKNKDIIIVGPPRSGTTWIGKVLSANEGVKYVHEPDNERVKFLGYYYKKGLHRFSYLKKDSTNEGYLRIFTKALNKKYLFNEGHYNHAFYRATSLTKEKIENNLSGNGINDEKHPLGIELIQPFFNLFLLSDNRKTILKSVHACLSVPYLVKNLEVDVLVVIRNPLAVVSSYVRMKMLEANRHLYRHKRVWNDFIEPRKEKFNKLHTPLEMYGFQVGLLHYALKKYSEELGLTVVRYEEFYPNPKEKFKEIYDDYGLLWNNTVEEYIDALNKKGSGYNTNRNIKEQFFEFKNHLTKTQVAQIIKGYNVFENQFYSF